MNFPDRFSKNTQVEVKVKFILEQATKAQRGSRGIALLFFNLGARWGGWSTPRPGRFTPEKDPVPTAEEAAWAPGPVRTGAENLAPPPPQGFDPRIVQPLVSRYTDCATPATKMFRY